MTSARFMIFGVALALAGVAPATAGPRQDAQAGISRCDHYGNDREYLDCIYGAVQPLRSSLGLSNALPAQLSLVQRAPSAMTALIQAPSTVAASAAAGSSMGHDGGILGRMFGGNGPQLHMTAYSLDKRGLFTITLSDGAVWQQLVSDTSYAQLGGRASDYIASVTQGDAGNATMDIRGVPGTFAVQRIR